MWRLRWYMVFVLAYDVCVGFGIWRLHRQMKFMLAYGVCFGTLHHRQYGVCVSVWLLRWFMVSVLALLRQMVFVLAFDVHDGI